MEQDPGVDQESEVELLSAEETSGKGSGPLISKTGCTWHVFDEDDHVVVMTCSTGKPALFYNCNESGPVCEEHVCRCRPSLLTERAEKARREAIEPIERIIRELRKLDVPEEVLAPVLEYLRVNEVGNGSEQK